MGVKTKVNLRHHVQYNAWKYLLLIVASIFLVDLVYTMTAYRSPEDKRIDVYIQNAAVDQNEIDAVFEQMRLDKLPDVEQISSYSLMTGSAEDVYAVQQLTTYLAAGEGDIYILTGEDFKRYASQGVFVDFSELIEQGTLKADGMDLSGGYVAIQEYDEKSDSMVAVSQQRLYGIPLSQLPGFTQEFGIYNQNMYLSMTVFNGNDENVLLFINQLIERSSETEVQEAQVP